MKLFVIPTPLAPLKSLHGPQVAWLASARKNAQRHTKLFCYSYCRDLHHVTLDSQSSYTHIMDHINEA